MLYQNGTFVDDVVVHKLSENDYLIVINAGTREKDVQWVRRRSADAGRACERLQRLLHAAGDPGADRRQETLQKLTRRGSEHDQELLVYVGHRSAGCTM